MTIKHTLLTFLTALFVVSSSAQILTNKTDLEIDYANPIEYEIGGITVSGVKYLDNNALITLSGIAVGDKIKIPGEKTTKAIEKLWAQGLFENIKIEASKIQGNVIFLNFDFKERPRLSKFSFSGVRKAQADDIREKIKLTRGDVITDHLILKTANIIRGIFIEKGYLNAEVNIKTAIDSTVENSMSLLIDVDKKNKVKINSIDFIGNNFVPKSALLSKIKETKEKFRFYPFDKIDTFIVYMFKNPSIFKKNDISEIAKDYFSDRVKLRIFKSSKFIAADFETDKTAILDYYNEIGFRDAQIIKDSIIKTPNNELKLQLTINEGKKFYFRNIVWVGNSKYTSKELSRVLNIKNGDVYNQKQMERNLQFNMDGFDIYSMYLDDGYLFFNALPVETKVENDSIDIEIRVTEGKQARVNKITIVGNTKTNDNVVIREIRTVPGQLFSRADLIRSQRELANLRYFNQEKIGITPKPNPVDGTVDIEFAVEEASSDQLELSGGWGAGMVVGTIGVSFNNFSTRNFFKKSAWRPIPSGDGQKISIRAQSNGSYYQSYSASFTEPWLGGKKPNALSFSVYHSVQSNGLAKSNELRQSIDINGISVSLTKRLKWPDDFFIFSQGVSFQNYTLSNYTSVFTFSNGYSNNLNYIVSLGRNSVDKPTYPTSGSDLSLSLQLTPPYSLVNNKDYSTISDQDRFKWLEYYKAKFQAYFYINPVDKFVASLRFKTGYLGSYNRKVGDSPFERFYLGGDGLSGFALDGRELVGMRGYSNNSLTPTGTGTNFIGATIYTKYTAEIRYPVSLNPSATIYLLSFVEAGNTWIDYKAFNPFKMYRSAGFGVRVFLPMFGMLGLDWGYGFDEVPKLVGSNKGQFHFSINQSID
ncbi:MAG: POTRA domain-containing protein [Bacteroidota bacterium]